MGAVSVPFSRWSESGTSRQQSCGGIDGHIIFKHEFIAFGCMRDIGNLGDMREVWQKRSFAYVESLELFRMLLPNLFLPALSWDLKMEPPVYYHYTRGHCEPFWKLLRTSSETHFKCPWVLLSTRALSANLIIAHSASGIHFQSLWMYVRESFGTLFGGLYYLFFLRDRGT